MTHDSTPASALVQVTYLHERDYLSGTGGECLYFEAEYLANDGSRTHAVCHVDRGTFVWGAAPRTEHEHVTRDHVLAAYHLEMATRATLRAALQPYGDVVGESEVRTALRRLLLLQNHSDAKCDAAWATLVDAVDAHLRTRHKKRPRVREVQAVTLRLVIAATQRAAWPLHPSRLALREAQ